MAMLPCVLLCDRHLYRWVARRVARGRSVVLLTTLATAAAVVPWIFIFAGGLVFPMVIVASDACRGLPNVGHHYIKGSEGALCNMLGSAVNVTYTAGGPCSVHVTSTSSIDLRFAEIFADLLGSCSKHPTALSGVFTQAAALVATLPSSTLNATLNMITGSGDTSGGFAAPSLGVVPRAALLDVLETFGVHLSATLATFLSGLGGVLTCDAL